MTDGSVQGFIATAIRLFFLLTPFFVLSSFLSMTHGDGSGRTRLAVRTAIAIAVAGVVLYFFGTIIFATVGVTLDAFRVGAGGLLFVSAVSLVRGGADMSQQAIREDISVVPLAIPIAIGPATTGALMVMGAEDSGVQRLIGCLGIVVAAAAIGMLLAVGGTIERALGRGGIAVLSKLTGLMLSAMAAQLLFTGARGLMQGQH